MSQTIPSLPFKPYWRRTEPPGGEEDPPSWVFFVVTKVSGQYRPVAIASAKSYNGESVKGYFLAAICQRLLTIFSSPANEHAIRAEVALAPKYYAESTPKQYELPELPRLGPWQYPTTLQQRMWEFPFISTCLLQGIKWHAQAGWHETELEYLGTVYRDTSLVWGMVVVDITDLRSIEYGIVAFKVARMIHIESHQMDRFQDRFPRYGSFRVAEDERPRRALSAREYISKFEVEMLDENANRKDLELLDRFGIVSESVMHNIWPPSNVVSQDLGSISNPDRSDHTSPINAAEESQQTSATIRDGHLNLEHLDDPMPELLLHVNDTIKPPVRSISIFLNARLDGVELLVQVLSSFKDLQELVVVCDPLRVDDALSFDLYSQILNLDPSSSPFRCRLIISGLFSAGLAKQPWLEKFLAWNDGSSIKNAHYEKYPVQQVLFRLTSGFVTACLSDALLPPLRFVSGLLQSLDWSTYYDFSDWQTDSHHLTFSGCSSSLGLDFSTDNEITPLPAKATADSQIVERNLSRVCDLDLQSWTVLVKHSWVQESSEVLQSGFRYKCIRYAFVRPRNRLISIESSTPVDILSKDLDIVGMETFLSLTSPAELDSNMMAIKQYLHTIGKKLERDALPHKIPDNVKLVALMSEAEVFAELPGFFRHAKEANEQIFRAMDKERCE